MLLVLMLLTGSLSQEVSQFLAEYQFNGYTSQWKRGLYLNIDQPCTLWLFLRENLEGAVCAAGGETVLDISMELKGPETNISEENPDDMPVIYLDTGYSPGLFKVIVSARDMLYGSQSDSVYVFCAMKEVRKPAVNSDPAEPE
ncbi:hypothetical protein CSA37_07890 [Candidatus Fermentibacteria bacterium]|nr:MAG: hypothetical protein CSA37_07890 [Candidatus Fermentibacteria bacterium]